MYDLLTPLAGYHGYQKNGAYKSTYNENLPTILVFYVSGHMFCYFNIDDFTSITIKCAPKEMTELKERFPDAIGEPYNGNKRHWISVKVNSEVNDTMLKQLVLNSYELVKRPSSRKK